MLNNNPFLGSNFPFWEMMALKALRNGRCWWTPFRQPNAQPPLDFTAWPLC